MYSVKSKFWKQQGIAYGEYEKKIIFVTICGDIKPSSELS